MTSVALADMYVCPSGDHTWYRPDVGIPVPVCPTHRTPLVRAKETPADG